MPLSPASLLETLTRLPHRGAATPNEREAARGTLLERRALYRQRLEQIFAGLPEDSRRALSENWTDQVIHEKWQPP